MKATQVAPLVNEVLKEMFGEEAVAGENLENIVDAGKRVMSTDAYKEQFTKLATDRIARIEIENRELKLKVPNILKDNYEWGSAREVIQFDLPEATETQDWKLVDLQEYPDNIFYEPKGKVKFYNSKTTFTVPISKTDEVLKTAFSNPTEMYSYLAGIDTAVNSKISMDMGGLIKRTINSLIGDTVYAEFPNADYTTKSGVRAINLLKEYNDISGKTALTVDNCLLDRDFLAYAAQKVNLTASRMMEPSKIFNLGGLATYTPKDLMHTVLLDRFTSALDYGLYNSTFHEQYVKLKEYGEFTECSYWQGSGTSYEFSECSKINVTTGEGNTVELSGILGIIFDHYAVGVTQENLRTNAKYIASANFTNEWHKQDASYFENTNHNAVVFFIA